MRRPFCPFMSATAEYGAQRCSHTCALAVLEFYDDHVPSGRWRCGLVPPDLGFGEEQRWCGEARDDIFGKPSDELSE